MRSVVLSVFALFAIAAAVVGGPAARAAENHAALTKAAAEHAIKRLIGYVKSDPYMKVVRTYIHGGAHQIDPKCKAKILNRSGFVILAMPEFKAGVAHPVAGAWKDLFQVDRCGHNVTFNVLATARPDKPPKIGLLLPGETGAPVAMQTQGKVEAAALTLGMKAAACRNPSTAIIADTRLQKVLIPAKLDKQGHVISGAWREIWSVEACDKTEPVAIIFHVQKNRISFKAEPVSRKK